MRAVYAKALACLPLLTLSVGAAAYAAPCTNASLIGTYGFQEEGQFPGGGFTQFRTVGVATFDGHGNGSRTTTLWYSDFSVAPGAVDPIAYTVNPDCTFTYTYLDNFETYSGVIVNGGQKLLWLETTGDPSRSGQAERIHSSNQ